MHFICRSQSAISDVIRGWFSDNASDLLSKFDGKGGKIFNPWATDFSCGTMVNDEEKEGSEDTDEFDRGKLLMDLCEFTVTLIVANAGK